MCICQRVSNCRQIETDRRNIWFSFVMGFSIKRLFKLLFSGCYVVYILDLVEIDVQPFGKCNICVFCVSESSKSQAGKAQHC